MPVSSLFSGGDQTDIERVKRNVGRMIDGGAQDAEIDRYLADEGVAKEQLNTTWGQRFGAVGDRLADLTRVGMDTATRGWGDKLSGPAQQAETAATRERLGWNALPADIAGIAVSAPYQVGSRLWGGVVGAGEGIANAYGHQKNWVPSSDDLKDMAWEGAKGAAFGTGAATLGHYLGKWWNREPVPVPPAAERKAGNIEKVYEATGGDRDAFAKALTLLGYDASKFTGKGAVQQGMEKVGDVLTGGDNPLLKAGIATIFPKAIAIGGGLQAGAKLMEKGDTVGRKELDAALQSIRTPNGAYRTDPEAVARLRDAFAKMGIGAERYQGSQ